MAALRFENMKLGARDRLILAAGLLLILLASLFVPLVDCSYEGGVCLKGGYDWLWKLGSSGTPFYSIDKFRLFVEWVAIAAVTGIAWLYIPRPPAGPTEPASPTEPAAPTESASR